MEQKHGFSLSSFSPQKLLSEGPWIYMLTGLITLLLFFIFRSSFALNHRIFIGIPVLIILVLLCVGLVLWNRKHPVSPKTLAVFVFITAFFVHLTYSFYTGSYVRQHDVYDHTGSGHMGYIYYIYENGSLPDTIGYQFYHPPLSHILSALFLRLNTATGGTLDMGLESLRFLPFLYVTWITVISYRLLSRLDISEKARFLAFTFIALHPTLSILSSSINNDTLAFLFTIATFYYMIRWYQEPTKKNIVVMALVLAAAALSKISSLQIAIPIGFLFLVMLLSKNSTDIRNKLSTKKLWGQYILFAVISIPLALSFSIRNKILFNQSIGYVPTIGDATLDQYVGNYSFVERFVKPFSPNLFQNAYCTIPGDYNVYDYLLRCSIFGEFSYGNGDWMARILTIINAIIVFFVIVAIIVTLFSCVRKNKNGFLWFSFLLYAVTLWISYISFNISFPFACTMDFRYLLPMIVLSAIFLAGFYDWLQKKETPFRKGISTLLISSVSIFCAASSIWYILVH